MAEISLQEAIQQFLLKSDVMTNRFGYHSRMV